MNSTAHPSTSTATNRLSSRRLGRFLHRWAELDYLPSLLRRNPRGVVPEFARYVELNYLCHKSKSVLSSALESPPRPGLQPACRIAWEQVRSHVLCVSVRQRHTKLSAAFRFALKQPHQT